MTNQEVSRLVNPIDIRTSRGYWGSMIGIALYKEGMYGICELVGCTYSETHRNDLIPITDIKYYDSK